jgi:hypothetical protein
VSHENAPSIAGLLLTATIAAIAQNAGQGVTKKRGQR